MRVEVLCVFVSVICACLCTPLNEGVKTMSLRMPGLRPPVEDYYACSAFSMDQDSYITQYEALADAGTAHHILLYGCKKPASSDASWSCEGAVCLGQQQIMFAWAKNAQATTLPNDVGYHVGGSSGVDYLVMQVHYARVLHDDEPDDRSGLRIYWSTERTRYLQGIFLLMSGNGVIPAHQSRVDIDVSCRYDGKDTLHPFAYRTHAHTLGVVISAYKYEFDTQQYELLGKGNPQWPQAFYPMERQHELHQNDFLVGRCVYNSSARNTDTSMASTHNDEMCNFYMMYYTEGTETFIECANNQYPSLSNNMPDDSHIPLPPNPLLNAQAEGHHHVTGTGNSPAEPIHGMHMDMSTDMPNIIAGASGIVEMEHWFSLPEAILSQLGDIAGIDTDSAGNVIIFHRGDHIWNELSFNNSEYYARKEDGPITQPAIIKLNSRSQLVNPEEDMWGQNIFYLPHGLTVDHQDNIWVTDVALHQVMKFTVGERKIPALRLGEAFIPDSDEEHFCKPTDVAVRLDGNFFVSDGYCNSRIIMFDPQGHVIRKWGSMDSDSANPAPNQFFIPHSMSISESLGQLCVADRQNRRVQCFNLEGQFIQQLQHGAPVYAVAFKPGSDTLFAIETNDRLRSSKAFLSQVQAKSIVEMGFFNPSSGKSFGMLHDITVSKDGKALYLAQMKPSLLWKFDLPSPTKEHGHLAVSKPHVTYSVEPVITHNASGSKSTVESLISSNKIPILVALLLVVPVLCVLFVLLGFKIYTCCKNKQPGGFDMGTILTVRGEDSKVFTPLTAQEDRYTDSDDDSENSHMIPKR